MAEDKGVEGQAAEGTEDKNYLGNWKTEEQAKEGLGHLEAKLAEQGNEVGYLRKEVEGLRNRPAPLPPTPEPEVPDYAEEISAIQGKIVDLDPDDVGYQKTLAGLLSQSNALIAEASKAATLTEATRVFKTELDERDTQAIESAFHKNNPDFNTPEIQRQIEERMNLDPTGMTDALVAYRELERDNATNRATQLEEENAELKRLATVSEGANQTGKVEVTGGASPPLPPAQPKLTGDALHAAMLKAAQEAA